MLNFTFSLAIQIVLLSCYAWLKALEHGLGGIVLKSEDVKAVLDLKVSISIISIAPFLLLKTWFLLIAAL